jgi:hypothetical protein
MTGSRGLTPKSWLASTPDRAIAPGRDQPVGSQRCGPTSAADALRGSPRLGSRERHGRDAGADQGPQDDHRGDARGAQQRVAEYRNARPQPDPGERQSHRCPSEPEQPPFDHDLSCQGSTAGSQRDTDSRVGLPGGSAPQRQVGHVDA